MSVDTNTPEQKFPHHFTTPDNSSSKMYFKKKNCQLKNVLLCLSKHLCRQLISFICAQVLTHQPIDCILIGNGNKLSLTPYLNNLRDRHAKYQLEYTCTKF